MTTGEYLALGGVTLSLLYLVAGVVFYVVQRRVGMEVQSEIMDEILFKAFLVWFVIAVIVGMLALMALMYFAGRLTWTVFQALGVVYVPQ